MAGIVSRIRGVDDKMDCEECGGRLVKGRGFWTCDSCGLESEIQLTENDVKETNSRYTESDLQKGLTRWKPVRKEREPRVKGNVSINVWYEAWQQLKEYCNKKNLTIKDFLSRLILDETRD